MIPMRKKSKVQLWFIKSENQSGQQLMDKEALNHKSETELDIVKDYADIILYNNYTKEFDEEVFKIMKGEGL
jgi:hypothetical protein